MPFRAARATGKPCRLYRRRAPMDWYEVPADPLVSLPPLVLLLNDTIDDHFRHLFIGEAEQVLQYVLVMLAHERSGMYLRLYL